MIGFICINKKSGDSSTYCVNKVKRKVGKKCGHLGTLDPLASGVLPVGIGQATRLFDILLSKEKTYVATFDFAYSTPSLDLETEPDNYSLKIPTQDEINSVLAKLVGEIDQIPPAYSAKFVDGKRSYKLARKGEVVNLSPKRVTIYSIKLIEKLTDTSYSFEIKCGGGTYIRSIVRDMAALLNCYGVMTKLERTKSGKFDINNSVTIEEIITAEDASKYVIKPETVLDYPVVKLSKNAAKRLIDGLFGEYDLSDGLYKVFNEDEFWGVGEVKSKVLKMKVYVRDI